MQTAKLKAKKGVKVRDPKTGQHLAEGGEVKPLNTYWRRRLNDGDVDIVAEPSKKGSGKKED